MYSLRYILPAIATAGLARAACSGTTTIQNSGDASGLASCQTYSGTIAIATNTAEDIAIDGVKEIDGDLVVKNANNVGSISADDLETITGKFSLAGVRQLTSLDFPSLTKVDIIDWQTLPQLSGFSFGSGIQEASAITILDTQLQEISGFAMQEVDEITIQSNVFLTNASFDIETINTGFTLSANGQDLAVDLSSLTEAKFLNLQDLGSIEVPELKKVGGFLTIQGGSFESFEAPKLTEVGATLTIRRNNALTEISMEQLKSVIGGFVIASNPELDTISGLPKLETISGNLDFTGNFEDVELPQLSSVRGAFNMESQADISAVCKQYQNSHGKGEMIRGDYNCKAEVQDPKEIRAGGGGNGGDDEDFGTSLSVPTGTIMGLAGVLVAVFGLL